MLVFYHVIGPVGGGLKVDDGSVYRILTDALVDIRMPLFTFISGFIYSLQVTRYRPFVPFMRGKVRRLFFPLIFVGIPISMIQALAPGVNKEITPIDALLSVIWPINHFWFLQAIFLIFLIVSALRTIEFFRSSKGEVIIFLFSSLIYLSHIYFTHFFSIDGAVYLFPFFMTGMLVQRYFSGHGDSLRLPSFICIIIIIFIQLYLARMDRDFIIDRRSIWALGVGVATCTVLYLSGMNSRVLAYIGGYSFPIYLFHTVFAVGVRVLISRFGGFPLIIYVLSEVIAGILFPILSTLVISRIPLLDLIMLGNRRARFYAESPSRR